MLFSYRALFIFEYMNPHSQIFDNFLLFKAYIIFPHSGFGKILYPGRYDMVTKCELWSPATAHIFTWLCDLKQRSLTPVCLSFFICKAETVTLLPTSQSRCGDSVTVYVRVLGTHGKCCVEKYSLWLLYI